MFVLSSMVYPKSGVNQQITLIHEKKKQFECQFCDYCCTEENTLKRHVTSVHERKKPYQCQFCNKRFSQKGNMNQHIACSNQ